MSTLNEKQLESFRKLSAVCPGIKMACLENSPESNGEWTLHCRNFKPAWREEVTISENGKISFWVGYGESAGIQMIG